ncbi:Alpha/beta hydrolase fold [Parasponia andersonii]|uniref:Alpha/beta hydrolase fold n=1 Tax=Parasponia andersonii TaxID=3476 RepID=A0A2P5B118_PARAD|nr:Alpha/beta hydrolase fold [Parasponia andersonii]
MAGGENRKISAASARAHTRKAKQNTSFQLPSGLLKKGLALLFVGIAAWTYQAIQPPAPKICGSPGGPQVTAPRIKLRDGRHLAYKEQGVSKDSAKHKIVYVHGFDSCRHDTIVPYLSPELVEELGVYIVSFDRPGYGESDPNPKRSMKSMALDIEELADQLGLGSKFYVVGMSLGGQVVWSCLKYIPTRLEGAALIAPVINFWWTGFPANISNEAFNRQFWNDRWALGVAHHAPWLTYWWNTQKWFPYSNVIGDITVVLSPQDKEIEKLPKKLDRSTYAAQVRQQGEYESLHRDMNVAFGKWEFSPVEVENPFPNSDGSVHLWQGDEDMLVPASLQRHIAHKLPWIQYHELLGAGHSFPQAEGISDTIIKELLIGKK